MNRIRVIILILLIFFCSSNESIEENMVKAEIPYEYDIEEPEPGFYIKSYYVDSRKVAESFGFELDDYYLDIDGDNDNELICNCQYGIDGHREVYVYEITEDGSFIGFINSEALDLPGFNDWGANALQSHFDASSNMILIEYYDNEKGEAVSVPLIGTNGMEFMAFEEWGNED